MALRAPSRLAMAAPRPMSLLRGVPVRGLVSYHRTSRLAPVPHRVPPRTVALPQICRRAYADAAPATVIVKKRRGFFGWTWLLVKLGALAGTVWFGYAIWVLRRPDEQIDPDPNKKTLVVLGA